jgi:glutamate-1-semialdehyde aminotransferase/spore coat polysaccharide biosynthesis protein SpsF (cytidylyltransferase family)
MKVICITQARFGSSRLPGKVLKKIGGRTLLEIHLERASRAREINGILVATTLEPEADKIVEIAEAAGLKIYRGSTDDVLDRFYQAAKPENPDYVVRITSDCPLIDPELIDLMVKRCVEGAYDYCSNTLKPRYPDGMDVEVMKFSALEKAWKEASLESEREHVTPYIWKNSTYFSKKAFESFSVEPVPDYSAVRLTVDEQADFDLVEILINELGENKTWLEYVNYMHDYPMLGKINKALKRNEGMAKSEANEKPVLRNISQFAKSDEYRKKIHDLIPGGAHTYSKGDDQFPLLAPAAIAYGKGAFVWDIDDNKYLDCSMGLTSVSLGHAYEPVLKRVREELERGVNFQRPSVIEKEMAEVFLGLVPQHQMIKFAKNGSIVTTAAVKLARAYTGRKLVAFPGDHPFYSYDDWFIGKTPCSRGIPEELASLSVTYKGDDLESLLALFEQYPGQIACVISEPERNWGIPENYLEKAIALAHQNGALYIADEMITGFKTDFPGSIKKYKVSPDMATWGKGIANGFSFCALTGKKEVMELGGIRHTGAEKTFLISTTHGGETHGIAAGLATIHEFKTQGVLQHNHEIGRYFIQSCKEVIAQNQLTEHISLSPSEWMPLFLCKDQKQEASAGLRTLLMQEMVRRGVLFQGVFVPCFSHHRNDIDYFVEALNESLNTYGKALQDGFELYLTGEPAKPVFRKYL